MQYGDQIIASQNVPEKIKELYQRVINLNEK